MKLNIRSIQFVGILFLIAELILSIIFYKERGTYMDVAFQTFEMIRTNALAPQVYRFGSMFTQIFPFLGIFFKLPLWSIAMLYSTGVVIYNSCIFLYCAFIKKSNGMSLVFIIYSAMMITHMFFWIQSELSQAIPFIIFLLCYLEHKSMNDFKWNHVLILLMILVTMVFFHPLAFLVYLICSFIIAILKSNNWNLKVLGISVILASFIYVVKLLFFNNWYDSGAHDRIDNIRSLYPNYFNTASTLQFFKNSLTIYVGVTLSLFVFVFMFIKHKKISQLTLILLLILGYFFFINVSHPSGQVFYLENMYLAIPLFLSLAIVYNGFQLDSQPFNSAFGLACLLSLICMVRLTIVAKSYTERQNWFRHQISTYEDEKVILSEKSVPMNQLLFSWPSAYEIWMLSTIETGKTASIVVVDDLNKLKLYQDTSNAFIGIQIYPYHILPSTYFNFQDSIHSYNIID